MEETTRAAMEDREPGDESGQICRDSSPEKGSPHDVAPVTTADTAPGTEGAGTEDAAGRDARRAAASTGRPKGTGSQGTAERPRRSSSGSLSPTPVRERPARTSEPAAEPGRFGRATRSTADALGRFGRSRRALPVTLAAVTVVCLLLAGLAFSSGRLAWTDGPVANQAVIDVGGTAEVVGQTRESLEKIFSYDFTSLDDSVEAARTMSTGAFTDQYLSVFDQTIRTPATQQQLRQTATVVNIGVNSIRDGRAEVMALVQFNAERTSTGQSTNAPALLRVGMDRVDGRWKLAELTPLTAAS